MQEIRQWFMSALMALVCGATGLGVKTLSKLCNSVSELNSTMAVLTFTVDYNRQAIEKHGNKIDELDWIRDAVVKQRILFPDP